MEQTARPTKYIFVTGGVVSSLGKGLAAASIGALLEGHGYTVTLQKFDPYINVDPGTMSPYQHGEVYVTDDGAETDLDLGHYERFTEHDHDAQQQLDDRQDLHVGDPEGAARRLPRPDRAGHSAHHQRDQGLHPRGGPRRRRRARRDRRHRRRHREPAVPRGDPPVPPGRRPREHGLHPPHAGALHRRGRRAEDQADAAQRARPALDRHPARHAALPHRPAASPRPEAEDRPVLRRRPRRRSSPPGTSSTIYEVPLVLPRGRPRQGGAEAARACRRANPTCRRGKSWSTRIKHPTDEITIHVVGQVHRLRGLLQVASTRRSTTAASRTATRINIQWVESEALEQEGGTRLLDGAARACWCPAASARAARAA